MNILNRGEISEKQWIESTKKKKKKKKKKNLPQPNNHRLVANRSADSIS